MKVFIYYQATHKPYGGGNSFMKAFRKACEKKNVALASSINDDYDIIFFNACMFSEKRPISIDTLLEQKYLGRSGTLKRFIRPKKRLLVYRADGFRCFYAGILNDQGDAVQRMALQIADHVILQNKFGLDVVRSPLVGFRGDNHTIIYNGVDQDIFRMKAEDPWDGRRPLRIFSANWSSNLNKGCELTADLSELPGVECSFCGHWPKGVDPKRVRLMLPKVQDELANEYRRYDVFFHPSKFDMSPNVCLEAISSGLPIIYHPTSGIKEVAGDCGVELNESNLPGTIERARSSYARLLMRIRERREHFSIERCAGEYIALFERLIRERAAQAFNLK